MEQDRQQREAELEEERRVHNERTGGGRYPVSSKNQETRIDEEDPKESPES